MTLHQVEPGQAFIEQGGSDNDLFFLLTGRASVRINGLEVAVREAGTHVGEMAALDPAATRSASVEAIEEAIVASIDEAALSELAGRYPEIWKRFALELSDRLRQRGRFVRVPNDRPQLFISSSVETLPVAKEIQRGLRFDDIFVVVWTDGVFRGGTYTIDRLLEAATQSDFAVLVFGPDDLVKFRGSESPAPRDNVVFEFGLFAGTIGKERTLIARPRGAEIRLPSDLLGLTPLDYADGSPESLTSRIAPLCTDLREIVSRFGVR